MKNVLKFVPAPTLTVGLILSALPAMAQQATPAPKAAASPAQTKASPAAVAAAR